MSKQLGTVKEWHNPRNEDCPHNENPVDDCKCKRPVIRKPYRVVRVTDHDVGHRVNPRLVLEIYPHNGTLIMREERRRKRYSIGAADLYSLLVRRAALAAIAARKAKRAEKRKVAQQQRNARPRSRKISSPGAVAYLAALRHNR